VITRAELLAMDLALNNAVRSLRYLGPVAAPALDDVTKVQAIVIAELHRKDAMWERIVNEIRASDEAQTSPISPDYATLTHDVAPPDDGFGCHDEPPSRPV
jgi:hypothetical protein